MDDLKWTFKVAEPPLITSVGSVRLNLGTLPQQRNAHFLTILVIALLGGLPLRAGLYWGQQTLSWGTESNVHTVSSQQYFNYSGYAAHLTVTSCMGLLSVLFCTVYVLELVIMVALT